MLFSAFSFALMNVFVKQLSHIPAMEIVFFRCVVSAIACYIGLRGTNAILLGNNKLLLFLRGASGTIALYCFFLTIQNVPLASGVTLSYLSPIFTTIIAIFILSEKVKAIQWIFYAISFGGVFIIKGFDADFPTIYFITGILAAIFSGVAYNLVRSLKEKEHPLVIVLHFQIVGIIAGFIYVLFDWQTPQGMDWVYLIATGILTQLGQIHLTHALQAEKVAQVSIVNYTGIIYALIFGWLIFGEIYTIQTLLGIILVVTGVVLSVLFTRKQNSIENQDITVG
ncbi:MAG: DMT family transporter [Pyrinomonadaceae bacterium]|jgi:drug/metabolite transporter (DMT)-like permease|nr:DMT family transporter [Pyrinomonadaceae bacterium]